MRIAIDARVLERSMTGVGRYLAIILDNISKYDQENEYILFSCSKLDNKFIKNNIKNVQIGRVFSKQICKKLYSPIWFNFVLPKNLKKEKIDILFSPNNLLPLCKIQAKKIVTVHDIFSLVDKRFHSFIYRFYFSFILSHTLKQTDLIYTVSEHSKRDIMELFKIPDNKISVLYPQADERFVPRELSNDLKIKLQNKYNLPKEFVLYVGVIEERKNIQCILDVADLFEKRDINIPFVLIGRCGYGGKKFIKEIKHRKNLFYYDFIDDNDLSYIYNLSSIFFFPSFYEGFGLPVLEAMQSGIPVITSNTSALLEVVGETGIMFRPKETELFANKIEELFFDDEKKKELSKQNVDRAEKFIREISFFNFSNLK